MPADHTVQVSARVTLPEREAILAHGGLAHIVKTFLRDHASGGEEKLVGGMRVLEAQKREISEDRGRLEKELRDMDAKERKIDIALVGIEDHLKAFRSDAQKKQDAVNRAKRDKDLLLSKKLKGVQGVRSVEEWKKDNKLILLLQHSATESLKQADIERVVHKIGIEPDKVVAWLYQPSPEHMPRGKLDKIRCNAWGNLPSLQDLQKEGKINENFYPLLMKWLGLKTREDVDMWIIHGLEEQSKTVSPSHIGVHSQSAQSAEPVEQKVCQNGGN
jgi:hypothetical protein